MVMQTMKVELAKDGGHLLAQCAANPAILVTGNNRTEVRANLKTCITGFVQAFPETKKQFFTGEKMKKVVFVAGT